jgi:hypothetical protein
MSVFYINAKTPKEHASNVRFQLENVEGWLGVEELECARIKAECLLNDAQKLVASLNQSAIRNSQSEIPK